MLQPGRSWVWFPLMSLDFFCWPNYSIRTMALGSTQPLTEMSTRNLPGSKGWQAHKADNLTTICERTVYKMWEPRRLTALWTSMACYGDSFTFYLSEKYSKMKAWGQILKSSYAKNHKHSLKNKRNSIIFTKLYALLSEKNLLEDMSCRMYEHGMILVSFFILGAEYR
jgi:hypothetical protein